MPRRSAASLAVVPIEPKRSRPRLAPSDGAPEDVAAIFRQLLASAPADHFKAGDAPLVEAYAQAISLARQSALEISANGPVIGGRPSPWIHCQEKAHRAIAALSMRLRLSPQHRADARSAGRKANDPPMSIYESMRARNAEDEG
jgi:phage terminase small subunit